MKILVVACIALLTASTSFAHSIKVQNGNYLWKFKGGCGHLTVGKKNAYYWDAGCNGSKEYVAKSVKVKGDSIRIDAAYFHVKKATGKQLTGTWAFKGIYDIKFVRQ